MMMLYHSFPRARQFRDNNGKIVRKSRSESDLERGFRILQLIMEFGLMCAPEYLRIPVDPASNRKSKFLSGDGAEPLDYQIQSRACFTLLKHGELNRLVEAGPDSAEALNDSSHADVFGPFSIGLDPVQARAIGVLPTFYFYRDDKRLAFSELLGSSISGLSSELLYRISEIHCLFSILSYVEASADTVDIEVPDASLLREVGILIEHEDKIKTLVKKLSRKEANRIFRIFNTDRVPAWNLVEFMDMLFSVFQSADSVFEDKPLNFYQQNEWRLVHHKRPGMKWFCLSKEQDKETRAPDKIEAARLEIIKLLKLSGSDLLHKYWIIHEIEGHKFRDLIKEIVVPERYYQRTLDVLNVVYTSSEKPEVKVLNETRWQLDYSGSVPVVMVS